jgi:phosphoribosyl-AMP cyclohydrolase
MKLQGEKKLLNLKVLKEVKFNPSLHKDGTRAPDLIAVILENYLTKEVLYGAAMNEEALEEAIRKRLVIFIVKAGNAGGLREKQAEIC